MRRDQYILVRDGKIAELGPLGAAAGAAGGVAVVDLRGSYVMAGLFNMHTHFSLALPGPLGDSVRAMSPHELMLYVADGARRTLRSGVTSVRCVGESDHAEFALRAAIDGGATPRVRGSSRPGARWCAPAGTGTRLRARSSATARTGSRAARGRRSRRARTSSRS